MPVAPTATGSAAPPGYHCSFCPFPAVNVVRASRRTAWQLASKQGPRVAYVCRNHIVRGVSYVRKGY